MGNLFELLFLLWLLSFVYSLWFFMSAKDSELDQVFLNKSKTFEESLNKFLFLEAHLNIDLAKYITKLQFYEKNAQKTRRKYTYYSDKIEPYLLKLVVGTKGTRFTNCWRMLDMPIKVHFLFISSILFIFSLLIVVGAFVVNEVNAFIILLFFILIIILAYFFNQIIKTNLMLMYLLIDGFLIIFKRDRAKLSKNVAVVSLLTSTRFLTRSSNSYAIGAVGVSAYSGFGGGGMSSFGGFDGGGFGGGGAGGSW